MGTNPSAGDSSSVPGSGRPPGEGDATHFGAPAGEIRAQRGLPGSSPPGGGAQAAPTGDTQAPLRPRSLARGISGVARMVSLHRPPRASGQEQPLFVRPSSRRCKASVHSSLSASEARRSAKEKRKKKEGAKICYFITYFIYWGLVMYFDFDKYV